MGGGYVFLFGFLCIGSPVGFWLGTELAKMFPIESNLWGYLAILAGMFWVALAVVGFLVCQAGGVVLDFGALAGGGGIHP